MGIKSEEPHQSSPSTSDEEWKEFEKNLDAQVDGIFQMAENMGVSVPPEATSGFDEKNNIAMMQVMDELHKKMMERKRSRNFLSLSKFIIIFGFVVTLLGFINSIVPGVWVEESVCSTKTDSPLCKNCFGPWPWNENWIYCFV